MPVVPGAGPPFVSLLDIAATNDLTFVGGHFYPNKAPGTMLLAIPGYFLVYHLERLSGLDPDDWWILTINAWLTSALSVGLLSALGCVVFFRTAVRFSGPESGAALGATSAFAFGTIYFPYATMLMEQGPAAVLVLAAFFLLMRSGSPPRARAGFVAGWLAGWSVITTYVCAAILPLFALYALVRSGFREAVAFTAGVVGPIAVLIGYNLVCFGAVWVTSYGGQNPSFEQEALWIGVFRTPRLDVLLTVLFSPYRGLFYGSPVLLLGVAGLVLLLRGGRYRFEALFFLAVFGVFLAFNASFNGWHGGWGIGPRYLLPAIPLLALSMVPAFGRWPRLAGVLSVISIAIVLVGTAVDPQSPIGSRKLAIFGDRPLWRYDPLLDHHLPLFLEGRLPEITRAEIAALVAKKRIALASASVEERERTIARLEEALEHAAERLPPRIFPLSNLSGPVSANPIGAYEGWFYRNDRPGSVVARWNSFNAGELLFPESRASLLPLLVVSSILGIVLAAPWARSRKTLRAAGKEPT